MENSDIKDFPLVINELTILFKDVVVTGKFGWGPSMRTLPTNIDENDDVYQPSSGECDRIDPQEGSGDSEEIQDVNVEASAGVSAELRNMNLSFPQGNNSGMSHGERKRGWT